MYPTVLKAMKLLPKPEFPQGTDSDLVWKYSRNAYLHRKYERIYGNSKVVGPLTLEGKYPCEDLVLRIGGEIGGTMVGGWNRLATYSVARWKQFKSDYEYHDEMYKNANIAIDGLDQFHNSAPTDFLEMDVSSIEVNGLQQVGDKARKERVVELPHARRPKPVIVDDLVGDDPVTLVGSSRNGVAFVRVKPPILERNYVIKKGQKMLYCNSLLKSVRVTLGPMVQSELNRKVIRRTAVRMCESHGLRPGDTQIAVEVVVRMYWYKNQTDRMLDGMCEEYESRNSSVVRRLYRRLCKTVSGGDSLQHC